jgi:phospholipase C
MTLRRREFLRGAVAAAAAGLATPGPASALAQPALPDPATSGIDHIVVVMMENRSFDHFLGWLPNADGRPSGLTYEDESGVPHEPQRLAPDFIGCAHPDPDHSYDGGRVEWNTGSMDGFLKAGGNDEYSIGWYGESDLPFLAALARHYTALDRYFCSILSSTFPNRLFLHAAQTDRLRSTPTLATIPTIWDRLAAAGVTGRYYYSNVPFLALWGERYMPISRPYWQFLVDAATGRLPAVSFVDPRYTLFDNGRGNDDHPHTDVRRGQAFLARAFRAVAESRVWPKTVFVVTYDEWGGFSDHVAPPRAAAPNDVDPDLVGDKALLGFRIPAVVASPWSRGSAADPRVAHGTYDHTSILKLIEWRYGLSPLTARDASADVENLATALDFTAPDPTVPGLPRVFPPRPTPCSRAEIRSDWVGLAQRAARMGWAVDP